MAKRFQGSAVQNPHVKSSAKGTNTSEIQRQSGITGFPNNDVITLSDLVNKYSDLIPLCFKVVQGFCAENEKDPTIDIEDVYNAHLVKRTDLVTVQDMFGDQYNIPFYSAVRFGLVYEGTNQSFGSIGELIDANPVPKIVAVTSQYVGQDSKSSIHKNEILVITGVHRSKFGNSKLWLNVFSVTYSQEKKLLKECKVNFSTSPYHTRVYVTDLLQHVPDLLPCRARLFLDVDSDHVISLPDHLTSQEILLEKTHTDTTIVMSLVREHGKRKQNDFIDVPVSIGIEVILLNPECYDDIYKNLYIETDSLQKKFDPGKLQPCLDARDDDTYVTQAQLFAAVRKDQSNVGWHIQSSNLQHLEQLYQPLLQRDPEGPYEDVHIDSGLPDQAKQVPYQRKQIEQSDVYEDVNVGHGINDSPQQAKQVKPGPLHPPVYARGQQPKPLLKQNSAQVTSVAPLNKPKVRQPHVTTEKAEIPPIKPQRRDDQQKVVKLPTVMSRSEESTSKPSPKPRKQPVPVPKSRHISKPVSDTLEPTVKSLQSSLNEIIIRVQNLESQQKYLQKQLLIALGDQTGLHKITHELDTFDSAKVQKVLEAMNLSQYKDLFAKEKIDGQILKELDEDDLVNELGITSRIHRARLMKIISGKVSANDVLAGHVVA